MDQAVHLVRDALRPGEHLLWRGRPSGRFQFARSDLLVIPLSVVFVFYSVTWEIGVVGLYRTRAENKIVVLFGLLVGAMMCAFSVYLLVGRLLYKTWRKRHTEYVLTNQKVAELYRGRSSKELPIHRIEFMSMKVSSDGTGAVRFGDISFGASLFEDSGMDFILPEAIQLPMSFLDIQDPKRVVELIEGLRAQGRS